MKLRTLYLSDTLLRSIIRKLNKICTNSHSRIISDKLWSALKQPKPLRVRISWLVDVRLRSRSTKSISTKPIVLSMCVRFCLKLRLSTIKQKFSIRMSEARAIRQFIMPKGLMTQWRCTALRSPSSSRKSNTKNQSAPWKPNPLEMR